MIVRERESERETQVNTNRQTEVGEKLLLIVLLLT